MLCLCEQVHRGPVGFRAVIGDHCHLRRPGDHVDAHLAKHLSFSSGHVDIPGPNNLVYPGNTPGTVGQRSHRLGAADTKRAIHTGQVSRSQHRRVDLAVGRWYHHDDLAYPGDLGGGHGHQYR